MNLVDELQQAAAQAMDDASAAAHAFMPAYEALQAAAQQVGQAWAGAWVPHIGNLYQRQLQPLAALRPADAHAGTGAHGDGAGAPRVVRAASPARGASQPRVPAALMASCRVFTPQDIRDAIRLTAGLPDMAALQAVSVGAAGHFVQAAFTAHVLLARAAAECGDDATTAAIATLRAAASQVRLADRTSLADAWRAQQSGHAGETAAEEAAQTASPSAQATRSARAAPRHNPFETVPAHITEWASLQALRSPIDGLLKLAGLLRQAADHLDDAPADSRPGTFPPQGRPCPLNTNTPTGIPCPTSHRSRRSKTAKPTPRRN